jgi:hypothetical protein
MRTTVPDGASLVEPFGAPLRRATGSPERRMVRALADRTNLQTAGLSLSRSQFGESAFMRRIMLNCPPASV